MSVIEVVNVSKRFGKTLAVDNVSFRVEPGQIFGFLGPNGSGKTTTIGMLVGIVAPTAGTIRLFESKASRALHRARKRLGGTLEQPNLYPYLTGWQNLRIVAAIKGADSHQMKSALKAVDMLDRSNRETKTYSLGMKQRLALAGAILGDPELLILDEPTNGLDPDGIGEIRELILRLANLGKTIFLSSHLLSEVERLCSHVAIIKNGRLLTSGPVAEITKGTPIIRMKARDMDNLLVAVKDYPETSWARIENDAVVAALTNDDSASLNRHLSRQEIFLSELTKQGRSLEEAFMQVTGDGEAQIHEQSR